LGYGESKRCGKVVVGVSGSSGSGKTTYAARIAEALGFKLVSAGKVFRELAKELGVSLEELSRLAVENPEFDFAVEKKVLEEVAKSERAVVEGHLAAWTVAESAKLLVFLDAPLEERVSRIASREGRPLEEVLVETTKRELFEALRFKRFYGVDVTSSSIFHVKLDTSAWSREYVERLLVELVREVSECREPG